MVLLIENERSEEVPMTIDEVLKAIKWLTKERERIRLKSMRFRRAKGIPERKLRVKPDPNEPVKEKRPRGRPKKAVDPDAPKRPRGRPRKSPVADIQVVIPPVQEEPVVQEQHVFLEEVLTSQSITTSLPSLPSHSDTTDNLEEDKSGFQSI